MIWNVDAVSSIALLVVVFAGGWLVGKRQRVEIIVLCEKCMGIKTHDETPEEELGEVKKDV